MEKRVISTELFEEENRTENSLRPKLLSDYIGQAKAKEKLKIYIEAAKARGESLDHVLLYGPPGLGKTTLAGIIANEMDVNLKITSGPAIEKPGELASILNNLQEGDLLFVDEIHRLNRQVEEVLYPAMEDYAIDIVIGKGASARSIRLDLPKFTLVGATTRAGMLTAPLRDRFWCSTPPRILYGTRINRNCKTFSKGISGGNRRAGSHRNCPDVPEERHVLPTAC